MTAVETPAAPTAAWRERVDSHLERLSTHLERLGTHVAQLDTRLERLSTHVAQLDTRLVRVEATLPHLATKADVANAINALTWRLAAIVIAGLAALAAFLKLTGG
jgi:phage shock protein A